MKTTKIKIEEVISVLEAGVGEAEHVIPSEVLESAIEYLKDYEDMKAVESWREFPEGMGLRVTAMTRLTDKHTAAELKRNCEGLRAAGIDPPMSDLRYIRLAEYEDIEEMTERSEPKPLRWQRSLMINFLRKG